MLISRVSIRNFRGITTLDLDLDPITVVIGENNTCKTSVLEAVYTCLGRSLFNRRSVAFSEFDFHLAGPDSNPDGAPPIEITLEFHESANNEWPEAVVQGLSEALQVAEDGRQSLRFRVTGSYQSETQEIATEVAFLNKDGEVLPKARGQTIVSTLQQFVPAFFLGAIRDATQHFGSKGPFWAPFSKNPEMTQGDRLEIEEQLAEINKRVVDAHAPFSQVKASVSKAATLVPLDRQENAVSIEAVPARALDLLSRAQLKLATRSSAKLPINNHGAGTQSLSVIFLFESFLKARLESSYDKDSSPLLALEEPESHLHPSAVRALWQTLADMKGQKIIATHSGDLMSEAPLSSIRRLARVDGAISQFRVKLGDLTPEEEDHLGYVIRAERGALFYARCWLLVEGKTEYYLFPDLARSLGKELIQRGIAVVEYAQQNVVPLIKIAKMLGIEWHVVTDGDEAGERYAAKTRALLGADAEGDRLTILAERDIENHLWQNGFSATMDAVIGVQQRRAKVTVGPGHPDFDSQRVEAARATVGKTGLAREVIKAVRSGTPISPRLAEIIEKAVTLAARQT